MSKGFSFRKIKRPQLASCCKIEIPDREPQTYIPNRRKKSNGVKKLIIYSIIYKERKVVNSVLN
jgi:hypothetical protein